MTISLKNFFEETLSPTAYQEHSVLAEAVGTRMLERLSLVTLVPNIILDIGCGTGQQSRALAEHYPSATVIALDTHQAFLRYAQETTSAACVLAEAAQLPFLNHSVDMIFANLFLPWCQDLQKTFSEWRRILRPEGLLMFTTFGPDTLKELACDKDDIPNCWDMHVLGDALVSGKFSDPVMDVEYFSLNYPDTEKMKQELIMTGMLKTERPFVPLNNSLTFEIVYGHAWGKGMESVMDEEGVAKFPLEMLKKR